MALIGATVTVQFRIKDLLAYSKAVAEPTRLLSALAEREVASFFVTQTVDQLVGPERIASSETLKDRLQKAADTALADSNGKPQSLGLEIVFVGFSAVHPPSDSEVAASFHEQIGALQEKQATIEKAHQDATEMLATVAGSREDAEAIDQAITSLDSVRAEIEGLRNSGDAAKIEAKAKEALAKELVIEDLLTRSNGKAAQLISGARAYRWQRSVTEQAKASRFLAELSAYGKAPELYRTRRYLETLAEGLDKSRKFVIGSQSTEAPVFRLDLTDNTSSMDAIFKNN
jgi:regulator of protease activity HflC (stomatin/prohibitin superfamily)